MFEEKKELVKSSEKKPDRDEKGRLLPGNTANPNGRPKGTLSVVDEIKRQLALIPNGKKKSNLIIIVSKIIEMATKGDNRILVDIINRIDGLPKQDIKLGLDETIGEVKIDIVKNEDSKPAINNSVPKKLESVPEKTVQDPDKRGGDGVK